jgi:hypothetical protein
VLLKCSWLVASGTKHSTYSMSGSKVSKVIYVICTISSLVGGDSPSVRSLFVVAGRCRAISDSEMLSSP